MGKLEQTRSYTNGKVIKIEFGGADGRAQRVGADLYTAKLRTPQENKTVPESQDSDTVSMNLLSLHPILLHFFLCGMGKKMELLHQFLRNLLLFNSHTSERTDHGSNTFFQA